MGGVHRKYAFGLIAAVATLAFGVGTAQAADTILADTTCCTYAAGPYFQDLGEIPSFENPIGADPHNVTSTTRGPDGKPLFRSKTILGGSTSLVNGAQYLSAGTYNFFCTFHGPSMNGELTVEGDKGTIVARPKIDVTIRAQSLNRVRSSGKLKVKVRALTQSSGIALKVKKGAKRLGGSSGLTLAAGSSRTVKVKLTASGVKSLKSLKSASVSVKGSVAFGRADSTRRKLK